MSNFGQRILDWFQHTILGCVERVLDMDKDGSLGVDDAGLLFSKLTEAFPLVMAKYAVWKDLTPGQRVDAVCDFMAEEFPDVDPAVWVLLDGVLWLVNIAKKRFLGK